MRRHTSTVAGSIATRSALASTPLGSGLFVIARYLLELIGELLLELVGSSVKPECCEGPPHCLKNRRRLAGELGHGQGRLSSDLSQLGRRPWSDAERVAQLFRHSCAGTGCLHQARAHVSGLEELWELFPNDLEQARADTAGLDRQMADFFTSEGAAVQGQG